MVTKQRRFTISVTPEMKFDLDAVKKERYSGDTQNEMMRDLICRGLSVLKVQNKNNAGKSEKEY